MSKEERKARREQRREDRRLRRQMRAEHAFGTSSDYLPDDEDYAFYDDLFQDTDYWNMYQSIKHKYASNLPVENFWTDLTGKTQTNYYNHYMSEFGEYDKLLEKMRDEEFNSPVEQLQRQTEAGLNSDLLGLSGVQPTSERADPSVPVQESTSPVEQIQGLAGIVMQAVQMAFPLAERFSDLQGKRFERQDQLRGFAEDFLYTLPTVGEVTPEHYDLIAEQLDDYLDVYLSGTTLSRKQKKQVAKFVGSNFSRPDIRKRRYKDLKESAVDRNEYNKETAGTAGAYWTTDNDTLMTIADYLGRLRYDLEKVSNEATQSEAGFYDDYYDALEPGSMAQADNAESNERKQRSQTDSDLKSSYREFINDLKEEDTPFSKALLAVLHFLTITQGSFSMSKKGPSGSFGIK